MTTRNDADMPDAVDQDQLHAALAEFDAVVAQARRAIMEENKKLDAAAQQQLLDKIRSMSNNDAVKDS